MGIQLVCSPLFKRKIFFFAHNRVKIAGFNAGILRMWIRVSKEQAFFG
jgi:hypothetical protein